MNVLRDISKKIVIITNGNYFASLILKSLLLDYRNSIIGMIFVMGDYNGKTGINALWNVGKRTALPYTIYKLFTYIILSVISSSKDFFDLIKYCQRYSIPYMHSNRIATDNCDTFIKKLDPDIIVSVSCPQKIPQSILQIASLGAINIHSSLLPKYAGLAPYFWVLAKGEKNTGTTVHYMTGKFDDGNILSQREIVIESGESAFNLFHRLAQEGGRAIVEAVEEACNCAKGKVQNVTERSYYSHPKLRDYFHLKSNGYSLFRIKDIKTLINEWSNK